MDTLEQYFQNRAAYRQELARGPEIKNEAFRELRDVLASLQREDFEISFSHSEHPDKKLEKAPEVKTTLTIKKHGIWISFTASSAKQGYVEKNSSRSELMGPPMSGDGWISPSRTYYVPSQVESLDEISGKIGYWQEANRERFAKADAAARLAQQQPGKPFWSRLLPGL